MVQHLSGLWSNKVFLRDHYLGLYCSSYIPMTCHPPSTSDINNDTALYTLDNNAVVAAERVSKLMTSQLYTSGVQRIISLSTVARLMPCFSLGTIMSQSVLEIKDLGVLLYSTLSFRRHIDCITSRAYRALSTLHKSQTHLPLATRRCCTDAATSGVLPLSLGSRF